MAIDTIKNEFENERQRQRKVCGEAINSANMEVFYQRRQSHPELFNMQTTATAVVLEKDSLAIAARRRTAVCTASGTGARDY